MTYVVEAMSDTQTDPITIPSATDPLTLRGRKNTKMLAEESTEQSANSIYSFELFNNKFTKEEEKNSLQVNVENIFLRINQSGNISLSTVINQYNKIK